MIHEGAFGNLFSALFGSWKTTILGVGTILATVGNFVVYNLDADPLTNMPIGVLIAGVTAGVGLIMARDNDKKSEQVGAK